MKLMPPTIIRLFAMACLAAALNSCKSSDFGQEKLFGAPGAPLLTGQMAGPVAAEAASNVRPPAVATPPSSAVTLAAR